MKMSKSTKWFIFNLSNILKNLKNQNETQNEGWTVTVIDHHTKDPMDLANSSITTTEGTITEVSEGQIQDSKMTWQAPAPTTPGPGFTTSPVNTTIGIDPNTNTTKGPDNTANGGPVNTTIGIESNTNTTKGPDNTANRGPVNTTIGIDPNTNTTKGPDNNANRGPVNTTIGIDTNTNTTKGPDNSTGSNANKTIEPDITTSIRPDVTTTTGALFKIISLNSIHYNIIIIISTSRHDISICSSFSKKN